MSANVRPWVDILRLVPGNDYLELLGQRTSTMLALPGE
jgi:hypothetical protein